MKLPFSMSSLTLTDGELYSSHKKKVDKMKKEWNEYPFTDYEVKPKGKKSFVFVRVKAVCPCGRKSNIKCVSLLCSKCCKTRSLKCRVH